MYITKMTEESGPGMKVILMDKETVSVIFGIISFYINKFTWKEMDHLKKVSFDGFYM